MIKKIAYIFIFAFAFFILFIFRPYNYVDNLKSQIICTNSKASFDIGPNYAYTLEDSLDGFNDIKARKLCQYGIIRDYGNTLKTPEIVNYLLHPVYKKESSWGDALVMFAITIILGSIIIEFFLEKKITQSLKTTHIISIILFGFLGYFIFFRGYSVKIFCRKMIAKKIVNFRNAAYVNGVFESLEENAHLEKYSNEVFLRCLKQHFF